MQCQISIWKIFVCNPCTLLINKLWWKTLLSKESKLSLMEQDGGLDVISGSKGYLTTPLPPHLYCSLFQHDIVNTLCHCKYFVPFVSEVPYICKKKKKCRCMECVCVYTQMYVWCMKNIYRIKIMYSCVYILFDILRNFPSIKMDKMTF